MVIIDLNLDQVKKSLVYSLAVPLPCLFLSLAYIVFAYQYLYAKRKQVIDIFVTDVNRETKFIEKKFTDEFMNL